MAHEHDMVMLIGDELIAEALQDYFESHNVPFAVKSGSTTDGGYMLGVNFKWRVQPEQVVRPNGTSRRKFAIQSSVKDVEGHIQDDGHMHGEPLAYGEHSLLPAANSNIQELLAAFVAQQRAEE